MVMSMTIELGWPQMIYVVYMIAEIAFGFTEAYRTMDRQGPGVRIILVTMLTGLLYWGGFFS